VKREMQGAVAQRAAGKAYEGACIKRVVMPLSPPASVGPSTCWSRLPGRTGGWLPPMFPMRCFAWLPETTSGYVRGIRGIHGAIACALLS
jgi:hypothetical protein